MNVKIKKIISNRKMKIATLVSSCYFLFILFLNSTVTRVAAADVWYKRDDFKGKGEFMKIPAENWMLRYAPPAHDDGFLGNFNPANWENNAKAAVQATIDFMFYSIYNGLWMQYVNFVYFVVWCFGKAYDFDLIKPMSKYTGNFIQRLTGFNPDSLSFAENSMFSNVLFYAILIVLCYLLYYLATSKATQFFKTITTTIMLLAISIIYIGNASTLISQMSEVTDSINESSLSISVYDSKTKDVASDNNIRKPSEEIQDNLIKTLVLNPWQILNFGVFDETGEIGKNFYGLSDKEKQQALYDPTFEGVKKREALLSNSQNSKTCEELNSSCPMTNDPNSRFWSVIILLLGTIPIGFTFLSLAFSMISAQIFLEFMLLISPFILIFAVIPKYNYLAARWGTTVFLALMFKIFIGVAIMIFCVMMQAVNFTLLEMKVPYIFLILVQTFSIRYIYKNRKKLLTKLNPTIQNFKDKAFAHGKKAAGGALLMTSPLLMNVAPAATVAAASTGIVMRKKANATLKGEKTSASLTNAAIGTGLFVAGTATGNAGLAAKGASQTAKGLDLKVLNQVTNAVKQGSQLPTQTDIPSKQSEFLTKPTTYPQKESFMKSSEINNKTSNETSNETTKETTKEITKETNVINNNGTPCGNKPKSSTKNEIHLSDESIRKLSDQSSQKSKININVPQNLNMNTKNLRGFSLSELVKERE